MKAKNPPPVKHRSPGALLATLAVRKPTTRLLLRMICDVPSMLYYEADKWLTRNRVKAFGIHCAMENKLKT